VQQRRFPVVIRAADRRNHPEEWHVEVLLDFVGRFDAAVEVLEAEGVPPDKIWLETGSSNTYENAVYGCEILRRHGIAQIVLVDEARFLPRAVACFRKQGMKVVPAAFNFTHLYWEADDILPTSRAIHMNGELVHEYLGLLWYRLRGRI